MTLASNASLNAMAPKPVPVGLDTLPAESRRKVVVRSHSKAIYFYPTLLVALLGAWRATPDGSDAWGNLFLVVFLANLLVVMFEFGSMKVLLLSLVGLVLGLTVFSFGFLPLLEEQLARGPVGGYALHQACPRGRQVRPLRDRGQRHLTRRRASSTAASTGTSARPWRISSS